MDGWIDGGCHPSDGYSQCDTVGNGNKAKDEGSEEESQDGGVRLAATPRLRRRYTVLNYTHLQQREQNGTKLTDSSENRTEPNSLTAARTERNQTH